MLEWNASNERLRAEILGKTVKMANKRKGTKNFLLSLKNNMKMMNKSVNKKKPNSPFRHFCAVN